VSSSPNLTITGCNVADIYSARVQDVASQVATNGLTYAQDLASTSVTIAQQAADEALTVAQSAADDALAIARSDDIPREISSRVTRGYNSVVKYGSEGQQRVDWVLNNSREVSVVASMLYKVNSVLISAVHHQT
jgi:hypothetical protein